MTDEEVVAIRLERNNIAVDRMITDESCAFEPIPKPVKTFEQCFADYPDLLGKINRSK